MRSFTGRLAASAVALSIGLFWLPAAAQIPVSPPPLPIPSPSPSPSPASNPNPPPPRPSPSPRPAPIQSPLSSPGGNQGPGSSSAQPPAPPGGSAASQNQPVQNTASKQTLLQPAGSPALTPALPGVAPFPIPVPDIKRTPPGSTTDLTGLLLQLADLGVPRQEALGAGYAPFPVAGPAYWSDDWMEPRITPTPHLHEGNDIFAAFGTLIIASGPGTVAAMANTAVGGLAVWVAGDNGDSYYYAHLIAFADGMAIGQRVDAGVAIGFVGNTGDAAGGPPHVHFEYHPALRGVAGKVVASGVDVVDPRRGVGSTRTPPVDPKSQLDAWLSQAKTSAAARIEEQKEKIERHSRQAYFMRRLEGVYDAEPADRPGDLLVFSALEPTVGAIGLARDAVASSDVGTLFQPGTSAADEALEAQVRLAVQAQDVYLSKLIGQFGVPGPPWLDFTPGGTPAGAGRLTALSS